MVANDVRRHDSKSYFGSNRALMESTYRLMTFKQL